MTAPARSLGLDEYLLRTRGRAFNILVVTAALAIYEVGLLITGLPQRNAADAILKRSLAAIHERAGLVFQIVVLALFLLALGLHHRRGRSLSRYLGLFLVECLFWAVILAPAIFFIGDPRLARPDAARALLDLGAGVYEEILFRYLLIRGLAFLLGIDFFHAFADESGHRLWPAFQASGRVLIVVLISALAFSLYHHVGPGGEPWIPSMLVFRFLAGLLFAGLFFLRGLGVCVYAHAFYDLLVHFAG